MTDTAKVVISVVVSGSALVTFLALYLFEIRRAWKGGTSPADPINDRITYVATAVSGLVAAIVATALSLPVSPVPPNDEKPAPASEIQSQSEAPKFSRFISELGNTVAGDATESKWKKWLALSYVVAYIIVGLAAMITWVIRDASSLIKAQALTFIGMMLAATKAFLTE